MKFIVTRILSPAEVFADFRLGETLQFWIFFRDIHF